MPIEDHTVSSEEKSRQSRHSKLGGTGHKRLSPHKTFKVSEQDVATERAGMKDKSPGFRWKVVMDQGNIYKHGKSKGNEEKKGLIQGQRKFQRASILHYWLYESLQ